MPLIAIDEVHALQIQAGALGRKAGHQFEDDIARKINALKYPFIVEEQVDEHVFTGNPATLLLSYIGRKEKIKKIATAAAISTGALATSEEGKNWLLVNGLGVSRCKSDLVITLHAENGENRAVGVSTKQCNNKTPTNAQLYFTTARAFSNLLQLNGISISENAVFALRQFCGDQGFRPIDDPVLNSGRTVDPRRYFWEEINTQGRAEWENIFSTHQDNVSRLLFQKAYLDDPFIPEYLLHKTKSAPALDQTEVAIYTIDELVALSRRYQGFNKKSYSVKKGSYKDPYGITHDAPRFGVIQMQRGGQKQHPEQLQFNLEAGYFYKLIPSSNEGR
jgi:hypothetical protein